MCLNAIILGMFQTKSLASNFERSPLIFFEKQVVLVTVLNGMLLGSGDEAILLSHCEVYPPTSIMTSVCCGSQNTLRNTTHALHSCSCSSHSTISATNPRLFVLAVFAAFYRLSFPSTTIISWSSSSPGTYGQPCLNVLMLKIS